jgi:hypothetical protein
MSDGFGTNVLDEIEEARTSKPSRRQKRLVEYVLRAGGDGTLEASEVVRSVCTAAAYSWKDTGLWQRTMDACNAYNSIAKIGEDIVLMGFEQFGFEEIRLT